MEEKKLRVLVKVCDKQLAMLFLSSLAISATFTRTERIKP